MRKQWSEKRKQKRADTLAAKAAARSRQLCIGGWRIYRLDEHNIVLQPTTGNCPEKRRQYYPTLADALRSLFHRLIEPEAKTDVQGLLHRIEKAEQTIVRSFNGAEGGRRRDRVS